MNYFGNYLKKLRGKQSLRVVQKGTGISHTYLSTLEKGYDPRTNKERKPTPEILKKLASYYCIPYSDLLEKAGYLNPEVDWEINPNVNEHLSITTDLYYLLSNERNINFKNKLLSIEEKEKILIFIEKVLLN